MTKPDPPEPQPPNGPKPAKNHRVLPEELRMCTIASLGLEIGRYGNKTKTFDHRNFADTISMNAIVKRFLEEHSEHERCKFVFINCMKLDDPGHDNKLRGHTG